jgi:hypothetical protein
MEHNQPRRARRPLVREWPTQTLPRPTIMLNYLYRHLADWLGVAPEPERIIAAREERAQDFAAYVQALMRDGGIEQLVVDSGYPGQIPCAEFAQVTRLPTWEILRLDAVMFELAETTDDFAALRSSHRLTRAAPTALRRAQIGDCLPTGQHRPGGPAQQASSPLSAANRTSRT